MKRENRAAMLGMFVLVTIFWGVVYVSGQQMLRHGADEPQIEMAQTAAQKLESGQSIGEVLPAETVEMSQNMDPYLMVFDGEGELEAATVTLDGTTPTIPEGLLTAAAIKGINKVTWQPRPGVRSATVTIPFSGEVSGYVLAGRSLATTEEKEDEWLKMTAILWAITITVGLAVIEKKTK